MEQIIEKNVRFCGCCHRELPVDSFYVDKRTLAPDNYCNSADMRMDAGIKIELGSFMIRTARHSKDYTGGSNQYCDMPQLQSMIDKLLS